METIEEEKKEYQIKITGGFYISEPIDTKKSIKINLEADIYSAEKRDLQQNNEFLIVYKGKVLGMPEIKQGERKIRAVVRNKKSQAWRYAIESMGKDYDQTMGKMLENSEEILDFIDRL